jgi:RNA polymerase sigma-70 factor (ECF subfamily)
MMSPGGADTPNGRDLLEAARDGDEQAFGRLALHHRRGLELYCQLMLGCPHAAREAVYETLVRGWRGVDRLAPSSCARIWLYRLATDVCLENIDERDATPGAPMSSGSGGRLTW